MLFQVNYKIVTTLGSLSRRVEVVDAKDPKEAAQLAEKQIKTRGIPYKQIGEPTPF